MQGNNTTAETEKPDVAMMTDGFVGVVPLKVLARRLRLLRLRVRCPFPPR